jgi:hypothetical protein
MSTTTATITTTTLTTKGRLPSAPLLRDKVTYYGEIRVEGEKESMTIAYA